MSRMTKILLFAGLLIAFVAGCDRFKDDTPDANQAPTVRFVNFPEDSTQFSYAPIVYWQGFDPDGFVTGFEFYDDISAEGLAAYRAGDAEFNAYLASIPNSVWTFTRNANQQIYLLTEVGEVTEHVFLVRSVDNLDSRSSIVARTFFRTNQAPNAPKIRWAESDTVAYFVHEAIADTQLVGDTLTITYTGIRLLWQGSDPDSRTTNIIPLQFSYALVNSFGDSIALPVRDDSNHVVGVREGWSNWGGETQIALFGLETGDYTFYLRVRDDGYTESDTMGTATFTVVKPTLSRMLLIVDENKPPSAVELQRGGINSDTLKAFYDGVLPDAIDIANTLAPLSQPPGSPPIRQFYVDSIAWLDNRSGAVLSYDYISQFSAVWVINDDNTQPGNTADQAAAYNKVLSDYMDIGGNVMLTGRRVFNKSQALGPGNPATNSFLRDYFNIFVVRPKSVYNAIQPAQAGIADFAGAVAGDPQWPDLDIEPTMIDRLVYTNQHVTYPPEIEYFGRSTAPASFDFATTLYNYKSSTSDPELYPNFVENFDCAVDTGLSTATTVALIPQDETLPLLQASTIRNLSRRIDGEIVHGDFIEVRNVGTNILAPKWRIFASIPIEAGEWQTSDTLEVTYRFIPLSADHDEPIALNFIKYDGTFEIEIIGDQIRTTIHATPKFRSCYFSFPLAYMKNDLYTHPFLGEVPAVSLLIANQLIFFNQNLDFSFDNR